MAIHIGKHIARVDGNILYLQMIGDISLEEIQKYIGLADQLTAEHGSFYIVDDMARFGSAAPEVRKKVASWIAQGACLGAAIYGASLSSRTMTTLILGAMKMMGRHVFPVTFVKTEQEARDWVGFQRHKHAAK
jgi:hypothetical protein